MNRCHNHPIKPSHHNNFQTGKLEDNPYTQQMEHTSEPTQKQPRHKIGEIHPLGYHTKDFARKSKKTTITPILATRRIT